MTVTVKRAWIEDGMLCAVYDAEEDGQRITLEPEQMPAEETPFTSAAYDAIEKAFKEFCRSDEAAELWEEDYCNRHNLSPEIRAERKRLMARWRRA